jgi:hypothetical protein
LPAPTDPHQRSTRTLTIVRIRQIAVKRGRASPLLETGLGIDAVDLGELDEFVCQDGYG